MRFVSSMAVGAASLFFLSSQPADALVLTIDDLNDGAAALVIDDATDFSPNDGIVFFAGAIGDFSLNVSTGLGDPAIGGGIPGFAGTSFDFTALSDQDSGTAALDLVLLDTGLSIVTGPTAQAIVDSPISFTSNAGLQGVVGVTVSTFININGGGDQLISTLAGSNGAFSSNESLLASLTATDTFDLRTVVNIRHENKGTFSGGSIDIGVAPVPVPAALPLFITALVGLGFVSRRRRSAA